MLLANVSPWLLLALGICAEIVATVSLKLAGGFERPRYLVTVLIGYAISFLMLSLVLRTQPVGLVYGIWAGCGVAGVALAGLALFNEQIGAREVAGFICVVIGVALLSK